MARDRFRRYLATLPVELGLPDGLEEAVTEDVALAGLSVCTDRVLTVGATLIVAVVTPDGRRIPLSCRVAHAVDADLARSLDRSPGMGLDIVGDPPPEWDLLLTGLRDESAAPSADSPLNVVILDRDEALRARLESHLSAAGFAVRGAASVAACLDACRQEPPDLVLADAETQGSNPALVSKALAADARLGDVAIVLMSEVSDPAARLQAFRRGVRDFLHKPFTEEELIIRLRRVGPRGGRSAGRVAFRGVLEDVSIPMVLSLLEYERKSGTLVLLRESQVGRLFICGGQVHRAELAGSDDSTTNLNEMLSWKQGSFGFLASPVAIPNEIGIPTQHLLIEHARKADEATRGGTD